MRSALLQIAYDAILLIGALPWALWRACSKKKKGPTLAERFGFAIPDAKEKPVIWIHSVSVGETKAARPLFLRLKTEHPNAFFLTTQSTWTGKEEAKRSLKEADAFAFLPLDLSFVMRRWAKKLKPTHFVLIEGDFWFNLLTSLKKGKAVLILASGKISQKSARRFQKAPFFAKKLFNLFDLFCVQNQEEAARFSSFRKDLHVTGNLKFDFEPMQISAPPNAFDKTSRPAITIASSHPSEEELFLNALMLLFPQTILFLAPRHPERFGAVKKLLSERQLSWISWSEIELATGEESVVLIDAMGKLPYCYAKSSLTFVAGSFVPHIGGHNVLEPCLYGCPSLFGPFAYSQKELTTSLKKTGAGLEVSPQEIFHTAQKLLQDASTLSRMKEGITALFQSSRGSAEKIFLLIREKEFGSK